MDALTRTSSVVSLIPAYGLKPDLHRVHCELLTQNGRQDGNERNGNSEELHVRLNGLKRCDTAKSVWVEEVEVFLA